MLAPIPIALLLFLAFALLWKGVRARGALALAVAWALYAGYEFLMYRRLLCSGECNIRVDLLLIYPVLFLASAWVLSAQAWRALRGSRRPQDEG